MHWIVDAMNVIGSRPDGWWRDRRAAMETLIADLDRWAAARDDSVTVVFERPPQPPMKSSAVEIAFAPAAAPNSADDEIVRLVSGHRDASEIVVVTSDSELVERVRRAGATTHPAKTFRDVID
jgi:predicted RNA-binding protein with PIN domain